MSRSLIQKLITLAMLGVYSSISLERIAAQEADYLGAVEEAVDLITVFSNHPEPLKRLVVYNWANLATKQQVGSLVLYLDRENRPVASGKVAPSVAQIKGDVPKSNLRIDQVATVLTDRRLEFRYEDRLIWHSPKAGIEFKPFGAAPEPAETKPRRLAQARALARRFSGQLDTKGANFVDSTPHLRLLPAPAHQYGSQDYTLGGTVDGYLFMYVLQGGQVALFIMIEAIRTDESTDWKYGLSRRAQGGLAVELDGVKIWEVPRIRDGDPTQCLYRLRDPR